MIRNILFDLDGTLTDPKVGITRCIQFALEHFDAPVPSADQLTWCIGPPLKDSFSRLLQTVDDIILDRALSLYRQRFSKKGLFENVIYQDVPRTLQKIRASGIKIYLATAKPRVFAEQILDHFQLSQFFHTIYGAELNGSLSDKGELVAHIIESENLDPKVSLMVGDRVYDIAGGQENGVKTAAVSYGYGNQVEIISAKPDIILDAISDLLSFLHIV